MTLMIQGRSVDRTFISILETDFYIEKKTDRPSETHFQIFEKRKKENFKLIIQTP